MNIEIEKELILNISLSITEGEFSKLSSFIRYATIDEGDEEMIEAKEFAIDFIRAFQEELYGDL